MTPARECTGCQWNHGAHSPVQWCEKYDRVTPVNLVAREHDPGRCWEAVQKEGEATR